MNQRSKAHGLKTGYAKQNPCHQTKKTEPDQGISKACLLQRFPLRLLDQPHYAGKGWTFAGKSADLCGNSYGLFGFPSPPRDGCPSGVVRWRETWSRNTRIGESKNEPQRYSGTEAGEGRAGSGLKRVESVESARFRPLKGATARLRPAWPAFAHLDFFNKEAKK